VLANCPSRPEDFPLALTCAAAIAFIVANLMPMMDLSVVGRFATTTIAGGTVAMWLEGQRATAVLVAFCVVIAPGFYIVFMLTLLLALRRSPVPVWTGEILRWLGYLRIWSMSEVMMLGVLVALVKIAELATVTPGVGMYALGAQILLIPAVMTTFDSSAAWHRASWVAEQEEQPRGTGAAMRGQPL
jgi:paraquat-inducible protein A